MNLQKKTIIKRLDRKGLINALRALKDNYILVTFEQHSPLILLKDREATIAIKDKN